MPIGRKMHEQTDRGTCHISFSERFESISKWLTTHNELWAVRPFISLPVSWESTYPNMAAALRKLSFHEIEQLEQCEDSVGEFDETFETLAATNKELSLWPNPSYDVAVGTQPRGISTRKWHQIAYLGITINELLDGNVDTLVDWCSGKGYLGRTLAQSTRLPVTCLEIDERLCNQGRIETSRLGIPAEFICVDVLSPGIETQLSSTAGCIALHACGALGVSLLKAASSSRSPFIALAPCCYHRIDTEYYVPLSLLGKRIELTFHKHHLRLISLDENVASGSEKEIRRREQIWRLSVDLLQREASGVDIYRPLGPVPSRWLKGSFEQFCRHLQERDNIQLPVRFDSGCVLRAGVERYRLSRALGLVRGLFRRTLESWMVLDRALFLKEQDYRVTITTFCPLHITPRNFLVVGSR